MSCLLKLCTLSVKKKCLTRKESCNLSRHCHGEHCCMVQGLKHFLQKYASVCSILCCDSQSATGSTSLKIQHSSSMFCKRLWYLQASVCSINDGAKVVLCTSAKQEAVHLPALRNSSMCMAHGCSKWSWLRLRCAA